MLKKIGFSAVALLGLAAMAPHQAKAEGRVRAEVGAPAYRYSEYPAYPVRVAPAPVVVYRPGERYEVRRDWDRDRDVRRYRGLGFGFWLASPCVF